MSIGVDQLSARNPSKSSIMVKQISNQIILKLIAI